MTDKEKGAGQGAPMQRACVRKDTKTARILEELLVRKLNRFDAEQIGDHCLNSTISSLQGLGLNIARQRVSVPTRFGKPVKVCEYWVPPHEQPRALRLLGR